MFYFIIGFCLVALVVMLAFRWFPKTATWLGVLVGGLFLGLFVEQWSTQVGEIFCYCWLLALVGLPLWWAVRSARSHGVY